MPTLAELLTIVACNFPSCLNPIFGPTAASDYWSASTVANFTDTAWRVIFIVGGVSFSIKDSDIHARAVRPCP